MPLALTHNLYRAHTLHSRNKLKLDRTSITHTRRRTMQIFYPQSVHMNLTKKGEKRQAEKKVFPSSSLRGTASIKQSKNLFSFCVIPRLTATGTKMKYAVCVVQMRKKNLAMYTYNKIDKHNIAWIIQSKS